MDGITEDTIHLVERNHVGNDLESSTQLDNFHNAGNFYTGSGGGM